MTIAFWKKVFPTKLNKSLLYDPAILLLGVYSRKMKTHGQESWHKKICS